MAWDLGLRPSQAVNLGATHPEAARMLTLREGEGETENLPSQQYGTSKSWTRGTERRFSVEPNNWEEGSLENQGEAFWVRCQERAFSYERQEKQ